MRSGAYDRSYILHVPTSYDGSRPIPVVVVLHGWTASAALAEIYTRMADEGEAHGFATVFPDGLGQKGSQGWNAGFMNLSGSSDVDDVKFVSDLLDQMERELNVDRSREYVCGHSNGAFLANDVATFLGNRLAAFGSVAGTIGAAGKDIPEPVAPISGILIHGTADTMVAYGPKSHALLKGVGADDSARWWASHDGCDSVPTVTRSGSAIIDLFKHGRNGAEVELVSIEKGTHSWPGGYYYDANHEPALETTTGVSAADLLWQFFSSHPRPSR
jgi:polyhydroxybutyrate depolymerase